MVHANKKAWIRIVTASSSSFKYWQQKCISACRFHYSFFRKGYSYPFPQIHSLTHMMNGDNNQPIHRPFYTHGYCAAVLPCDKATFGQKEAVPQREQIRRADRSPKKFYRCSSIHSRLPNKHTLHVYTGGNNPSGPPLSPYPADRHFCQSHGYAQKSITPTR